MIPAKIVQTECKTKQACLFVLTYQAISGICTKRENIKSYSLSILYPFFIEHTEQADDDKRNGVIRNTFNVLFYVNGSKEKNRVFPIPGRITANVQAARFSCKQTSLLSP